MYSEIKELLKAGVSLILIAIILVFSYKLLELNNFKDIGCIIAIILVLIFSFFVFRKNIIWVIDTIKGDVLSEAKIDARIVKINKEDNTITLRIERLYKVTLDEELVRNLVMDRVLSISNYKLKVSSNNKNSSSKIDNLVAKLKLIRTVETIEARNHFGETKRIYLYDDEDTTNIIIPDNVCTLAYFYISSELGKIYTLKDNIKIIGGKGFINFDTHIDTGKHFKTIDLSQLDTSNIIFWNNMFKHAKFDNVVGLECLDTSKMKTIKNVCLATDNIDVNKINIPESVNKKHLVKNRANWYY